MWTRMKVLDRVLILQNREFVYPSNNIFQWKHKNMGPWINNKMLHNIVYNL